MKREQVQEVLKWLNDQIEYANESIQEAQQSRNYGRESHYEGIRDAFMRCLNKLRQGE
jgi:hypothetical protein